MSNKKITIVIGRGFGDEGKGFAVHTSCNPYEKTVVIRHNGGGQSGHTVDLADGRRFIFHQLSSASFDNATTFFADTFYPDLYKLSSEIHDFKKLSGFTPPIFADINTKIVLIYDVLINMSLETMRGNNRHGSCGMGIYEADVRNKSGIILTISDCMRLTLSELFDYLIDIRDTYYPNRLHDLGISGLDSLPEEYRSLFMSEDVARNYAEVIHENASLVRIKPFEELIDCSDHLIFETGQGLLLDADNVTYLPHVTGSKTGLTNAITIMSKYDLRPTEIKYVTRSYVTRHGNGLFHNETNKEKLGDIGIDVTNQKNDWQGEIRYAYHEPVERMMNPIIMDLALLPDRMREECVVSLVITHLNETDNMIKCIDRDYDIMDFLKEDAVKTTVNRIYTQNNPYEINEVYEFINSSSSLVRIKGENVAKRLHQI